MARITVRPNAAAKGGTECSCVWTVLYPRPWTIVGVKYTSEFAGIRIAIKKNISTQGFAQKLSFDPQ